MALDDANVPQFSMKKKKTCACRWRGWSWTLVWTKLSNQVCKQQKKLVLVSYPYAVIESTLQSIYNGRHGIIRVADHRQAVDVKIQLSVAVDGDMVGTDVSVRLIRWRECYINTCHFLRNHCQCQIFGRIFGLWKTTVNVTNSANKYLRNKHAQTSSPSSRVLASTGSDILPSLRALESCPVKAVMVIEYRVNAVRFPTTTALISSECRTKLMLYPELSNWKRTKRNWSRNCQKVNRRTRYLKFMNSQQWCQWCMRWALRWPMVHPTQSLIQWQKETLRWYQEGHQGLRQKGRDKELGLFLSYMYVTILLLKSSGDLMNVPSKLHVCTAMILLPRRPKNTLCK